MGRLSYESSALLARDAWSTENPTHRARAGSVAEEYARINRWWTGDPAEIFWLEVSARVRISGSIFLAAAFSGLRLGELVWLRLGDVDFGGETIRVMGSVDPVGGRGTTKGGRGVDSWNAAAAL